MYLKETVAENRVMGHPSQGIYKIILKGHAAKSAQPGQFVHIQVSDTLDPLLRRPLSIAGIDREQEEITIYYRVAGKGTELLTKMKAKDEVSILGPLGTGFTVPKDGELLLIAGGIGVFPLYSLIQAVDRKLVAVKLFWGGENKEFLESADLNKLLKMGIELEASTLDGSYGTKGLVTGILENYLTNISEKLADGILENREQPGIQRAASCGPRGMLKAVSEICARREIPLEVSLEEHMACGVGACLGCVCTVKGADENLARKRVCKEGPVLDGKEVVWDAEG